MAVYKKSNSGYSPFIQKGKVTSPYTDIQNRAKVDSSLKCIMGVERVHVNSINKLLKESGPNGEPVYEADNEDSRIRFVGGVESIYSATGTHVRLLSTESYVEVTFYGTGVNVMGIFDSDTNRKFKVSTDGGVEGADIIAAGSSAILNNRSYKPQQIINAVSGLTLGWHTVKIRRSGSSSLPFSNFEILNEASQITVMSGKAHGNGYEYELAANELIDYNLGFDNVADVSLGTKGGRVITYIDPADGTVKKRITEVDVTPLYLGATDHSNEAPYRTINFREFGRNRGDDFSTLGGADSNRAFTLDDGTTTLVGNSAKVVVGGGFEGIDISTSGDFLTLTFVGTGLDIISVHNSFGNEANPPSIYVDGLDVGALSAIGQGLGATPRESICSGLPYGTHTVKIVQDGATLTTWSRYYIGFVIHQPKKPALPEGAAEIADYNVMADFVVVDSNDNLDISNGVLRKTSNREAIYTSVWSALEININHKSGIRAQSSTSGASYEYTFFGTGVIVNTNFTNTHVMDTSLEIDGSTDLSSFTLSLVTAGTGLSLASNPAKITGTVGGGVNVAGATEISGLTLGLHTVKVTSNNTEDFSNDTIDIITPIHSPHTTFGSMSMKDIRNFDSAKDVNKIAKIAPTYANINTTINVINLSKNISQILRFGAGNYFVYFEEVFVDKHYVVTSAAGQAVIPTIQTIWKNGISIVSYNTGGVATDTVSDCIDIKGKLDKDELEE